MENDELSTDSVAKFVHALRDPAQRDQAASKIWQRTHEHLERRIAGLVAQRLQGRISEDSVLNEAFRSFFSGAGRGEFEIHNAGGLIALLADIAHKKLMSRIRKHDAQKRSPGPSEDGDATKRGHAATGGDNARCLEGGQIPADAEPAKRFYAGREPVDPNIRAKEEQDADAVIMQFLQDAEVVVQAVYLEKIETLSPDLKACLRLRMEGFDPKGIADQMGISVEAAKWKIETLQAEFEDLHDDSEFGADAPKQRKRRAR